MTAATDSANAKYSIGLTAGLVDQKHMTQMGMAVWLYMWIIYRVTKITPDGMGKVLNGKPVTLEEVLIEYPDLPPRTYRRWLKTLVDGGYITTKRAPYGLIVLVTKAKKSFYSSSPAKNGTSLGRDVPNMAQPDVPNMAKRYATNGTSNKDSVKIGYITAEKVFVELAAIIQPKAKFETYAKLMAKALKALTAEELIAAARFFHKQYHGGSEWHSRPENQHHCKLTVFFAGNKAGIPKYMVCAEEAADKQQLPVLPSLTPEQRAARKQQQNEQLAAQRAKLATNAGVTI